MKAKNIIINVLLMFFFCVALLTALSFYATPLKWKLFTVQSGSMEPVMKIGSIIITIPNAKNEYKKDEIITYKTGIGVNMKTQNATVTHRIVNIENAGDGSLLYITKGDNNSNIDSKPITSTQIIGKTIIIIPFLGYVISFAKTQTGLILVIIIPAAMIIYSELLNIKKEAKKLLKKKRKKGS